MPVNAKKALRRKIYERDGGLCQICGGPVSLRYMSLDHTVPRMIGGPTTLENLRCTHPECNWRRGREDFLRLRPERDAWHRDGWARD